MTHRPDIDGLRAVAVLPVVLFHLESGRFAPGGYVGVDIFFVISGYLITRIIHEGMLAGTFSIADFYNRRVRRIFPALFAMYLFILLAASVLVYNSQAHTIGQSITASVFFVSNLFFHSKSGYFDGPLDTNPLLHTWSLSVEEQFYLLLPLVIFCMRRWSHRARIVALSVIGIVSFALSVRMVDVAPSSAFYMVQYRAWELMLGAIVAVGNLPLLRRRWIAEISGIGGLLLIGLSVQLFDDSTPFPGFAALAPCLGTALVIHSGAALRTITARFLALAPLQFVGLISYSFYLWHWPVIVFTRHLGDAVGPAQLRWQDWNLDVLTHAPSGVVQKTAIIVLCMALATLSWRFVERPFREKPFRLGSRGTLAVAGVAMAAMTVLSISLRPANQLLWQPPERLTSMLEFVDYDPDPSMRVGTCMLSSSNDDFALYQKETCLAQKSDEPNFLLLGDSHAAHIWEALDEVFTDVNFLQATASQCRPLLERRQSRRCEDLLRYIVKEFLPENRLDGIILSARWTGRELDELIRSAEHLEQYAERVIVFGPIVEYNDPLPRILAQSMFSKNVPAGFVAAQRSPDALQTDRKFATALEQASIEYVSLYEAMCSPECLTLLDDGTPLQFDYGHFTKAGSIEVIRRLKPLLFERTYSNP